LLEGGHQKAMSNIKHATALLKAFQKAPQIRCFRAPPFSVQTHSKTSHLQKTIDSRFLSSLLKRCAASSSTLHHGVPQVASWTGFIKRSFLTSAVSPDLLGKSGSSGIASSDQAQDTGTTEEKSEPVKGVETPNDEKGEDGLSKIFF
jgi:hypothetical protein